MTAARKFGRAAWRFWLWLLDRQAAVAVGFIIGALFVSFLMAAGLAFIGSGPRLVQALAERAL